MFGRTAECAELHFASLELSSLRADLVEPKIERPEQGTRGKGHLKRRFFGLHARGPLREALTWLILPVIICLS